MQGELGTWAFGVFWLQWAVSVPCVDYFVLDMSLGESVLDAIIISLIFTMEAFTVAGYAYAISAVNDPVLEVVVTGIVYPVLSMVIKEVAFTGIVRDADAGAGLAEDDAPENGSLIATVSTTEALLEIANKVAIAKISNLYTFVVTVMLSLGIEVAAKALVMRWRKLGERFPCQPRQIL